MWYENTEDGLRYDMPIFAEDLKYGDIHLLIPQNIAGTYELAGYDWFNIRTGTFNSSRTWLTAKEAVECYEDGHRIYNGKVEEIIK